MLNRLQQIWRRWHRNSQIASVEEPRPTDCSAGLETEVVGDNEFVATNDSANEMASLVNQMLAHHRYALLLRPQIAQNLTPELYSSAEYALNEAMGLVPAGKVLLQPSQFDVDYPLYAAERERSQHDFTVAVQSVFLDRYLVINRQFQQFVNAGGYEEMAIWDQEIWPAVLDFTDQSGHPGPRFWNEGHYRAGQANLPVVGVSWYEAAAYARWVGKRLPTDAEWVKAGSWPVTLSANTHLQRKYPWGDNFDHRKANLWGSALGQVVTVDEFSEGVSVGGLYQLIGNVWEWTANTLETDPDIEEALHGQATLLKIIRGGAFDTYFEHQATCHFASGENPIMRKHNIGFRCALSMCDIAKPPDPTPLKAEAADEDQSPCGCHASETFADQDYDKIFDDQSRAELVGDRAIEETRT